MDRREQIFLERLVGSVSRRMGSLDVKDRQPVSDEWLRKEALSICAGDTDAAEAILRAYKEDEDLGEWED